MADLTPRSLTIAQRQHGLITTSQLVEAGVGRRTMQRLERSGTLVAEFKTVRRVASAPRTLAQRCAGLSFAHPRAYITGVAAGKLMGLRKMPRQSPIHLASPHALHVEHPGVRIRRSTKVGRHDVLRRSDGVAIATPARLGFDLAALLRPQSHRSVIDQLIHEHGVTVAELLAVGDRLHHPTRPGSAQFLTTMLDVTDCPTESDAELRVARALLARGVPVETNTQWLDLPNGSRARLDLAVPSIKWGIEIDVHPSHLGVVGSTRDKRRDRQASLLGWTISRVTGLDFTEFDPMIDELVLVYRAQVAAGAA